MAAIESKRESDDSGIVTLLGSNYDNMKTGISVMIVAVIVVVK